MAIKTITYATAEETLRVAKWFLSRGISSSKDYLAKRNWTLPSQDGRPVNFDYHQVDMLIKLLPLMSNNKPDTRYDDLVEGIRTCKTIIQVRKLIGQ